MSRLLNPTHPNPLILLLRSCLPDWSSDRYFFSLVQPSTLAQQLFATAGTSLELSLLLSQLIVSIVSATVSTTVHKKMFVLMRLVCCSDATVWWDFFPSSGWFHFQPCPWCSLDSFWPWSLHNLVIVNSDNGGSEGAFDIWETQCARRRKQRGSWDEGGCHHCSGTSKDSWADVSKQDGCQVSSVNYFSNKNRLMFTWHHVRKSDFVVFNTMGSCFLLIFELVPSVFNQINRIFFDQAERKGEYMLRGASK